MKKRKGEVDGFWLFLIGIFVVLPAIKYFTGNKDESNVEGTRQKVVNSRGNILEINDNSAVSPINTGIRIPIKKGIVIIKKTSPDRGKPDIITVKGKYVITSFDKKGMWNIDLCDADGSLIDWIKVTVY